MNDREQDARPLLEQFQLLGDGIDRLSATSEAESLTAA